MIKWIVLWLTAWGGFKSLRFLGVDYVELFPVGILYFLLVLSVLRKLYRREWEYYFSQWKSGSLFFITLIGIITIAGYTAIPYFGTKPVEYIKSHPWQQFLLLDYTYAITKSIEILFQQLMICVMVFLLKSKGLKDRTISLLFGMFFCLAHMPLFITDSSLFGLYFTIAGGVAGIVFPIVMLNSRYGVHNSYLLHWLFYLFSAVLFWW